MSAATLVALRSFWLDRRRIEVGETFACADRLAAELITCGKAKAGDDATRRRLRIALNAEWNDSDGGEALRDRWNAHNSVVDMLAGRPPPAA
jgi:hypothetical protein